MTTSTVRIGGGSGATLSAFADGLTASGFEVVSDDVPRLDLAVFLDTERAPASLLDASPGRWLDEIVTAMSEAFSFVRNVVPQLTPASGGLVVATSLAGAVGVPGRSLDSASAGGLAGLARSVLHDAPSIWVMLLMESLPGPVGARPSADVMWDSQVGSVDDGEPRTEAIVRTIGWVCGAPPPSGTLITYTKGRMNG